MSKPLPPELEEFVEREIASGNYNSADDVVCDALRRLQVQKDRIDTLRKEIQVGLTELDRGEGEPLDMNDIRNEVRERMAEKHRNS